MNGELAVLHILKNATAVSAIVEDRIALGESPQGEQFPRIVIELSDNEPFETKSGKSATDHNRINVFSYAVDWKTAKDLANACRNVLDGVNGTFNSVDVVDIVYQSETTFNETIGNRVIYARDQDYLVRVRL